MEKNKKKERIFMVPTKRLLGIMCDRKIYFFVELDRIKSTKYKYKYRKETWHWLGDKNTWLFKDTSGF